MNNEEKILSLLVEMNGRLGTVEKEITGVTKEVSGIKQEVAGVKQEVSGLKQEVAEVKQQLNKMDEDNNKVVEMLARHMIDNAEHLERIEQVHGEKLENIEEKLDIVKDMSSDHDFEIRRLKKKLIS